MNAATKKAGVPFVTQPPLTDLLENKYTKFARSTQENNSTLSANDDSATYVSCARTANLRFINRATGEIQLVRCKCYACEFCGRRKVQRLYSAVARYFAQFSYVRMWTFTAAPLNFTSAEHAKYMQKAWQTFWKEWRRCKFVNQKQRDVKYFRVVELHESGYVHYHVIVTEWLKWERVQELWEWSLAKTCKNSEKKSQRYGSVNVRSSLNAKTAASYVAKYVMKAVKDRVNVNLRKWSRSEKTAIFDPPKKNETGEKWEIYRLDRPDVNAPLLNLSQFSASTQSVTAELLVLFDLTASVYEIDALYNALSSYTDE